MKAKIVLFICMISAVAAFSQNPVPAPPPPPPPPPPSVEMEEEIFMVVEDMPLFPGCDEVKAKDKKRICAEEKMSDFIYENLNYPEAAKEASTEGTVVIRFVVNKDGSVSKAVIVRDIGKGCGAEALRVVNNMPKWEPGKQRGRPVNVQYNLPVKFNLDNEEK